MANGAQFNKYKVWNDEKLTDTDINAAIDRIYENLDALGLGSRDTTSTHARETADPGSYANPNVAVTIQDQIHHLRYLVGRIIGGPNSSHLDTIPTTLTSSSADAAPPTLNLDFEGKLEEASTADDAYARMINKGAIINAASLSSADFDSSDITDTEKKYGKHSYALGSGNILAVPGILGNPLRSSLSMWVKGLVAEDCLAYNPLLGAELKINSSAKLEASVTSRVASSESAKVVHTVEGDDLINYATDMTAEFKLASLSYSLGDVGGAGTDQLKISWDGSFDTSVNLENQNIDINQGDGGVWFLGAKRNDPAWDNSWAADGLPTAMTGTIWSSVGTPNASVSNGSMNISTTGNNGGGFSTSSLVNLSNQTIEWKSRVNSVSFNSTTGSTSQPPQPCIVSVSDTSADRKFTVIMYTDRLELRFGNAAFDNGIEGVIYGDFSEWHTFRLTSGASYATKLYVDGLLVFSSNNTEVSSEASDLIYFGDRDSTGLNGNSNSDWEYFRIYDGGSEPPVVGNTQGYLDDVGFVNGTLEEGDLISLSSSSFLSVFGASDVIGPYTRFPYVGDAVKADLVFGDSRTSMLWEAVPKNSYYLPSDGITPVSMSYSTSCLIDGADPGDARVWCALDVNDALVGRQPELASSDYTPAQRGYGQTFFRLANSSAFPENIHTNRSMILPAGINKIVPIIAMDTSSAGDVKRQHSFFTYMFGQTKKIGK